MARGMIRTLFRLPCRRGEHTWAHPTRGLYVSNFYVCVDCGEPGFETPAS